MPEARPGWWARLASPFKEFGALAGSLYLVDRLLRALSPRMGLFVYELMVQPVVAKPLLPASMAQHLSYHLIQAGDAEVAEMPARTEIKAERFAMGAQCLGVYLKGKWVGYIWLARREYPEDEVRCIYALSQPEVSVFDFDLVVLPAYRMGVGFAAVWQAANSHLRSQGVNYSFSRVTRFNLASRRAHARLGCRRLGRAVFFKAGALECMVATVAPYLAVSWGGSSQARLRMAPDVLQASGSADPAG